MPVEPARQTNLPFFTVLQSDSPARCGLLLLPHGSVTTPVFMPVGTAASVKSLLSDELLALGYNLILGNSYHLALRPGGSLIEKMGGLRKFMAWDGNILTDSGGYQVFSLALRRKLLVDGVEFQNHIDGSKMLFSPKGVLALQCQLGSDIVMPLDICPPGAAPEAEILAACATSRRWYEESAASRGYGQRLFAIIQGGVCSEVRLRELQWALSLRGDLRPDGISLGGFSVGEPRPAFWAAISAMAPYFPADRPVYAMGIGDPRDLVFCATHGVDMFDCVLPTRNARNGRIYLPNGYYSIKREDLTLCDNPLVPECGCPTCQKYTVSYVRHLFRAGELSYFRLATQHNLWQFAQLMNRIREAIAERTTLRFNEQFQRTWLGNTGRDYLASLWK